MAEQVQLVDGRVGEGGASLLMVEQLQLIVVGMVDGEVGVVEDAVEAGQVQLIVEQVYIVDRGGGVVDYS